MSEILWCFHETIWPCYTEGFKAWDIYIETDVKQNNPYPSNTNEWYSWNNGWNTNTNGL